MQTELPAPKILRWILLALLALTSFSMCGVVLLVVLLWRTSSAVAPAPDESAAAELVTGAVSSAPFVSAAPTRSDIDEAARLAILSENRQALSQIMQECSTRRDRDQYQANLFRLAVEQARLDAFDVISSRHVIPIDAMRALSIELIGTAYKNGQFKLISRMHARAQQLGLRSDDAFAILSQELREEPWDGERFSQLVTTLSYNDTKIVEAALTSPGPRRDWAMKFLDTGYIQGVSAANMINNMAISQENLEPLMNVLARHNRLSADFILKNVKLFDAEQLDKFLPQLKNFNFTDDVAKHILTMPPSTAMQYFEQSDRLRFLLRSKWQTAQLKPRIPSDLSIESFKSVLPAIAKQAQFEFEWDRFKALDSTPLELIDWLWEHEMRPTQRSDATVAMYLGARFKSGSAVEAAVKNSSSVTSRQWLDGYDVFQTQADLAAGKSTRFKPLEEIIRQGDMPSLQAFCRIPGLPWSHVEGTHPVVLALQSGHSEMAAYLYQQGATLNEQQLAIVLKMPDIDVSFLNRASKPKEGQQHTSDWMALHRAVAAGELEKVDEVLKDFEFQHSSDRIDAQTNATDWKADRNVQSIITASFGYPQIMSRLQFEGFPFAGRHVKLAIDTRNAPALKVMLRDVKLRDYVRENIDLLLNLMKGDRVICQALLETGIVDELPEDAQTAIKREARLWGSKKQ